MNKKLKRVKDIPREILQICHANDLFTAKDVLSKTDIDLLALLDICYEDILVLLGSICISICPEPVTVCRLRKHRQDYANFVCRPWICYKKEENPCQLPWKI